MLILYVEGFRMEQLTLESQFTYNSWFNPVFIHSSSLEPVMCSDVLFVCVGQNVKLEVSRLWLLIGINQDIRMWILECTWSFGIGGSDVEVIILKTIRPSDDWQLALWGLNFKDRPDLFSKVPRSLPLFLIVVTVVSSPPVRLWSESSLWLRLSS